MSNSSNTKPRYKFFLRKLIITPDYATSTLQKARQKRLSFCEVENELIYETHLKREPNYGHFISKKSLNYLCSVDLTSKKSPYWLTTLNRAHHVKKVKIRGLWSSGEDIHAGVPYQKVQSIILYLRSLSKRTQAIELCTSAMIATPKQIFQVYQKISYLRQLRSYATAIEFLREAVKPVEQEFSLIDRKLARLKHLKQVEYDQMINNQRGLLHIMRENKMCPKVTSLGFHLCGDVLDNELRPQNRRNNQDTVMPFFRLHLFPNLIKLNFDNYYCTEPRFDRALGQEFSALKNLKELNLLLTGTSQNVNNLFEGMLNLPQLRLFSLNTWTLEDPEWKLFGRFLTQQKDLESLSLTLNNVYESTDEYKAQNKAIEGFGNCLRGKNKLESICLSLRYNSIESVSKLLAATKLKNQVKNLKIVAFDDIVTTSTPLNQHIEGLCNFIEDQKGCLEDFTLHLPYVHTSNGEMLHQLAKALTPAKALTSLCLKVNQEEDEFALTDLYEFMPEGAFTENQTRNPKADDEIWPRYFSKTLANLPLLEDLTLQIDLFQQYSNDFAKEYGRMMAILPGLLSLKYLCFQLPEHKSLKKVEPQIIASLKGLKSARYLTFGTLDVSNRKMQYRLNKIRDIIEKVNLAQSQKFDILSR